MNSTTTATKVPRSGTVGTNGQQLHYPSRSPVHHRRHGRRRRGSARRARHPAHPPAGLVDGQHDRDGVRAAGGAGHGRAVGPRTSSTQSNSASNPNPVEPAAYERQAQAYLRFDALDRLGGIHAPTLVVVGEQDLLTPPWVAREVAGGIPGARLETLTGDGSSHLLPLERPDDFNQASTTFTAKPRFLRRMIPEGK